MARRAVAPVVAVTLLILVTILAAGIVFTAVDGLSTADSRVAPSFALAVDAREDRIALTHRRGPPLDVRNLSVRIALDDRRLRYQPPIPFFAARGYESGPTGPFNVAADPSWTVGETAAVWLAGTNEPGIRSGTRVAVTVRRHGRRLVTVRATAR